MQASTCRKMQCPHYLHLGELMKLVGFLVRS